MNLNKFTLLPWTDVMRMIVNNLINQAFLTAA